MYSITKEEVMYCRNCRAELANYAVHCMICGSKPKTGNKFCHFCGNPTQPQAQVCVSCGGALTGSITDNIFFLTLLLAIFLGTLGIHRFLNRRIISGIFMLLTFGGMGLWWLIDIILIVTGNFKDSNGIPITYN